MEGKEGRDEEEVTSALLPIWKERETSLGKHKTTSPPLPTPQLTQVPRTHARRSSVTAVAQNSLMRQEPAGNHFALKRPLVLKEKIPQPCGYTWHGCQTGSTPLTPTVTVTVTVTVTTLALQLRGKHHVVLWTTLNWGTQSPQSSGQMGQHNHSHTPTFSRITYTA